MIEHFFIPVVSDCLRSSEPLRFQIYEQLHAAEKVIEVDYICAEIHTYYMGVPYAHFRPAAVCAGRIPRRLKDNTKLM
ncbi:hypothetical protein EVAR_95063_1 [Eumeta japonica]|uniref:Uncharacterized protein n=1 Tax=Eumeta variegata TaxID=151549 RepID=A0A4C1W6A8_EUMVA|nr:hypothetical protein EVAR_95063_1 [Eumeta japonica]